jgi:4-amino-4-deoxy-L-arabinose transferase-like glycosyltransferase
LFVKIKNNKIEFILLLLILAIASFLRFYNIIDFLHFANDEARDAFIVKNIFENNSIPLLGPETSIGHFYLGPIFYYFLTLFFLLFQFHPVSGAILSAILGVLSVLLLWKITRNIFSKEAALIASFLYSISFIVVLHSRWSWNPNIVPFFFLLYIYSFYKFTNSRNNFGKYLYLWIISLTILIQLHASTFILIPVSIILFLLYRPKNLKWQNYLVSLAIIIILFAPFLIYEIINNFENFYKIISVIFDSSDSTSFLYKIKFNILGFIGFLNALIFANFSGLNNNFSFIENINIYSLSFIPGLITFLGILIIAIFHIYKYKKKSKFIFTLFLFLLIFFIFSKKILFVHYYILFFPLIFILLGFLLSMFYRYNIFSKSLVFLIIIFISFSNFLYTFDFFSGLKQNTWQKHHTIPFYQTDKAVNFIVKKAKNDKIYLNCEIKDYCKSFEYLLELKGVKIDNNSNEIFRIYYSFDNDSDFKPIQIEKIN